MFDFINSAAKYRKEFPSASVLHILIVAKRYVTCNRIRSMFPLDIGKDLYVANIHVHYVVTDDANDIITLRGESALVALVANDVDLSGELKSCLYNSLQSACHALKVPSISDLIIRV